MPSEMKRLVSDRARPETAGIPVGNEPPPSKAYVPSGAWTRTGPSSRGEVQA
jgi:hypothetical protein